MYGPNLYLGYRDVGRWGTIQSGLSQLLHFPAAVAASTCEFELQGSHGYIGLSANQDSLLRKQWWPSADLARPIVSLQLRLPGMLLHSAKHSYLLRTDLNAGMPPRLREPAWQFTLPMLLHCWNAGCVYATSLFEVGKTRILASLVQVLRTLLPAKFPSCLKADCMFCMFEKHLSCC